jgi:hypothetical protein
MATGDRHRRRGQRVAGLRSKRRWSTRPWRERWLMRAWSRRQFPASTSAAMRWTPDAVLGP